MTSPSTAREAMTRRERYRAALSGEPFDRPPIWIMRQAGRYLPEYQAIRSQHTFWEMCLKPEVSAAATLSACRTLDVDLMIIFNDILTPLLDMGLDVQFPTGGPVITNPVRTMADVEQLAPVVYTRPPVADSIALCRAGEPDTPVLGFCGAPFTLAVYAVEGKMKGTEKTAIMALLAERPTVLAALLERLSEVAADYLAAQVLEGGADGVQIFESWGGVLLAGTQYEQWAAQWQRRVIALFRARCPGTPIHLYVRGSAPHLDSMHATAAEVLAIDHDTPLASARAATDRTLQGNLAPEIMLEGADVEGAFHRMLEGFDPTRRWIANLGHGVTPAARPENVRRFITLVQALGKG